MDKLKLYTTLYEREIARRNDISDSFNLPFTVLSLQIGLIYFIYESFDFKTDLFSILFYIILFLILFFSIIALLFLSNSINNFFCGFYYTELPESKKLFEYQENETEENFENYLINSYVEISDNYAAINDKRSKCLINAKSMLVLIFFSEIIAIVLHIFH